MSTLQAKDISTIDKNNLEAIFKASDHFKVERALMLGLIMWESGFNTNEQLFEKNVNDFSVGLCQVRYETAKGMGFKGKLADLFDPYTNVYYGARYLSERLHENNNNYPDSLSAYNAGHVSKNLLGQYTNADYVNGIMIYYGQFKAQLINAGLEKPSIWPTLLMGLALGFMSIYLFKKFKSKKVISYGAYRRRR